MVGVGPPEPGLRRCALYRPWEVLSQGLSAWDGDAWSFRWHQLGSGLGQAAAAGLVESVVTSEVSTSRGPQ